MDLPPSTLELQCYTYVQNKNIYTYIKLCDIITHTQQTFKILEKFEFKFISLKITFIRLLLVRITCPYWNQIKDFIGISVACGGSCNVVFTIK